MFYSHSRITNSPIADVFVVWAKCEDGRIRGFILERVSETWHPCDYNLNADHVASIRV